MPEIKGLNFKIAADTKAASKGVENLSDSLKELKSGLGVAKDIGDVSDKIKGLARESEKISFAGGVENEAVKFSSLKTGVSGLGTVFKKTGGIASKLFVKPVLNGYKDIGNAIGNKFKSNITGTAKAIKKLGTMFTSILKRRVILAFLSTVMDGFKTGVANLYQYSKMLGGTFAGSMDRIATSTQYLKNSIGAMTAPIVNALAPAIDFLIDKFVSLLNVVNQFFARLSGATTFTRAKKQAVEYAEGVSGIGSAAKSAAKDIRDATIGIDELNMISKQDTGAGGGSGGGAGIDYGGMFEEVAITDGIKDFTDKLKGSISAGDWQGAGTLLGNKFNEIVNGVNWSELGSEIGKKLNGVISTAYYFLDTANFYNLGSKVAELLNNAFSNIDWNIAGRGIVASLLALPRFLIGVVTNLDFAELASSVGEFITGALDEAIDFIGEFDWGAIGSKLGSGIIDIWNNVNFTSIANRFLALLGSVFANQIKATIGFFAGLGGRIVDYISDGLTNDDGTKKTGLAIVKGILDGIVEGIKDIGKWIFENVYAPFIDGFASAFGIKTGYSEETKKIGKLSADGFLAGFKDLNSNSSLRTTKNIAKGIINAFNKPASKSIKDEFKDSGKWSISGFIEGVREKWNEAKATIASLANTVVNAFNGAVKIASPSKVFKQSGTWIVEGLNNGIKENISSSVSVVESWGNRLAKSAPTLAMAVDSGALDYYNSDAFAKTITPNVTSSSSVKVSGFYDAMVSFYEEYVNPTMVQIANDAKRQADKEPRTVVNIGNKQVANAIDEQRRVNGYSFAR